MPDFLEVVESIQAEAATVQRVFEGEGQRAPSRRGSSNPQYLAKLAEAAKLIADVVSGKRPSYLLQEALSTSDFPILFGDILDRQLLAAYRATPQIWQRIARRRVVRDFRPASMFFVDMPDGVLSEVKQLGEYREANIAEGKYSLQVKKYGRRLPIAWETIVNDDLDALTEIPQAFGRASSRTGDRLFTELHVGASGPLGTFYTAGNKNLITGNPTLSIAGLQAAMTLLAGMVDANGEPIIIDGVILEVPPALEVVANNILNALQIEMVEAGGTANQKIIAQNWMKGRVEVVVNPYIPLVAKTANGNSTWFLHAAPSSERPAFAMGLLRGHEEPEIFMKSPNAQRVGGGMSDVMNGDFDSDAVQYKVRYVLGAARMNPLATIGSNGSGA